jgi:hypothetical protein
VVRQVRKGVGVHLLTRLADGVPRRPRGREHQLDDSLQVRLALEQLAQPARKCKHMELRDRWHEYDVRPIECRLIDPNEIRSELCVDLQPAVEFPAIRKLRSAFVKVCSEPRRGHGFKTPKLIACIAGEDAKFGICGGRGFDQGDIDVVMVSGQGPEAGIQHKNSLGQGCAFSRHLRSVARSASITWTGLSNLLDGCLESADTRARVPGLCGGASTPSARCRSTHARP